MSGPPDIRPLAPPLCPPTLKLLQAVAADPDGKYFTPHPFTAEVLGGLASAPGKDLYYVRMEGTEALAYGLLRGWNEGYAVPSLGLAVAPDARRRGLGREMMAFLHGAAAKRGASRVRLRVHPDNRRAVDLYRSLGYSFEPPDPANGLMLGTCELGSR